MAVKNTLMDLSDTLFEQLERLNEADADSLESEVQRARAMCGVAGTIIENANTVMSVVKGRRNPETVPYRWSNLPTQREWMLAHAGGRPIAEVCEDFGFEDGPCDAGEGCPAYEQGSCAVYKAKDIIRRARALAGVEVD